MMIPISCNNRIDPPAEPAAQALYPLPARRNALALAMAYVPMQCLDHIYSPETALRRGTLFPELDKPFTGRCGGSCNG